MKRGIGPLVAFVLAVAATSARAQSGGASSTGSIEGHVSASGGGAMPGVKVTVTGPSMMGAQTLVTSSDGVYRFPGVPAGAYRVTYEMNGFSTVVRDIRVGIGFTATIDISLAAKQIEESVTVTGEAPLVDATTTRVQTNFVEEQLDSLPNTRDMWSLLAVTPAVILNRFDVGGSTAGTQTPYIAYGNGGQNRALIEGINTTEGTEGSGVYLDYGSLDEVIVGTAANTVEMPSGGVLTNFVGKSGGNRLSGEVHFEYEHPDLQSRNVSDDQLGRGFANIPRNVMELLGLDRGAANTLLDYKDLNASVGGAIVKDKLWFWAGYMRQQNVVYQPISGAILDGTEFLTKLVNYTGKLTWQLTPKDRLIGYLQSGAKFQPFRIDAGFVAGPQHISKASTLNQHTPSWVGKLEYNRTLGSRGFLEIRAGEFGNNFALLGHDQTTPRKEDRTTLAVTGGGRDWQMDRRRKQAHGSYTFYVDNWAGGNHQFKLGGEIQHETGNTVWRQYYSKNVLHVLNNGAASAVRLGLAVDSWNGLRNYGLYGQDSYRLDRFTINLGLRYDHYRVFLPEQDRPASRFATEAGHFDAVDNVKTFNHLVPRAGVIFDASGNGKTLLKANYGRYYFNPGVGLADAVNPNASTQFTEYAWSDRNGDLLWQEGEQGAIVQQVGGTAKVIIDPHLRNSYTDELSTWIEHELPGQVGARVGFVWKMDRDGYQRENQNRPFSAWTVPTNVTDIGPDGRANTSDEKTMPAFGLPANVLALPVVNRVFNPEGFDADYKSFELAFAKRFSHDWSMVSSLIYTYTAEYGTSYFSSGPGSNGGSGATLFSGQANTFGFPITPNGKTDRSQYGFWGFKIHGTWQALRGLRFTPVFRIQQGSPYGRVFNATVTGVTQNFLAEAFDAQRMDTIKQLDLRAQKDFGLGSRVKLGLMFDVFNVLNENTELNINARTGRITISETGENVPTFESPVTILPPRIARFSATLSW